MPTLATDLWGLTKGQPYIDAALIPRAIEEQVRSGDLDYRTRLLIRDSVDALRSFWGEPRVRAWLESSPAREEIEAICAEEFDKVGFPSLGRRLVEPTEPRLIEDFLHDLGRRLRRPVRIDVGGSAVLILGGLLRRTTDDVDVVDEVPADIRNEYKLLAELEEVYGLKLAHFQSHYLAMRWERRTHTIGPFDNLRVALLDPHDVFVSKLFSIRSKDLADLRVLFPLLSKETLEQRLRDDCQSMLAAPELRKRAEDNWFLLTRETLPT
jgi:hypothetical protein